MKSISENIMEHGQQTGSPDKDICPDLILADTIECDALTRLYQPNDRQIRECCLSEFHTRCSLRPAA